MALKTEMPEEANLDFFAEEEFEERFDHILVGGVSEGAGAEELVEFTDRMNEFGAECVLEGSRGGEVILICGSNKPMVERGR